MQSPQGYAPPLHGIGTAAGTDWDACGTGASDIDPIIAGTQHLHQSQPRRLGIGLIRQEAHESYKVLRLLHSGSNVLGTGVRWQNVQRKLNSGGFIACAWVSRSAGNSPPCVKTIVSCAMILSRPIVIGVPIIL
ncbi:MAG TPA: hypothetical protein VIE89_30985 [Candidatus Binatia bacterium]